MFFVFVCCLLCLLYLVSGFPFMFLFHIKYARFFINNGSLFNAWHYFSIRQIFTILKF